jgi:hypothetical protein
MMHRGCFAIYANFNLDNLIPYLSSKQNPLYLFEWENERIPANGYIIIRVYYEKFSYQSDKQQQPLIWSN